MGQVKVVYIYFKHLQECYQTLNEWKYNVTRNSGPYGLFILAPAEGLIAALTSGLASFVQPRGFAPHTLTLLSLHKFARPTMWLNPIYSEH